MGENKNGIISPSDKDGVRYYTMDNSRQGSPRDKKGSLTKSLLIFGGIILALIIVGVSCSNVTSNLTGDNSVNDYSGISTDYIGVLYVEGTISDSDSSGLLSDESTYDHRWTLNCIDDAIDNPNNKGLIVFVNTPGGGVYESDELYLKLKEYKKTGRPLYAAMGSMAASGGYYISAAADKIIANRNCWTGSIGVTIGTLYDVSELLDQYGVKTVTITSGKNKAMGSMVDPLTAEQQQIFQSLVDEAYEQFVGIVADGRNMPVKKVKQLADGRIFTAKQAKKSGLVDEIGTLDEAARDMRTAYGLNDCEVIDLEYTIPTSIFDSFFMQLSGIKKGTSGEVAALLEMMNGQGKMPISYMSEVRK